MSGLGLDAYPVEPLPAGHRLLSRWHLFRPHIAFYFERSLFELRKRSAGTVLDVLATG